jgi:hypothetical protein
MNHLLFNWVCVRGSETGRESPTHGIPFSKGIELWHGKSVIGSFQKKLFAVVPNDIEFGAGDALAGPHKESVVMICCNNAL